MIRKGLYMLMAILSLAACQTEDGRMRAIEAKEDAMFDEEKKFDEVIARQLMDDYEAFVQEFPDNSTAPVYLDRAANIARQLKEYDRGLNNYLTIVERYPDFDKIIETKFLIAFIYDNEIKDKTKAEAQYRAVAQEYPDHVFGKNAKDRLITLHMTDEELLEFFKQKNQ